MHSLRKTKVLIASTLKPVDDTRLYEKIAGSLIESRHYDVHIVGSAGRTSNEVTAYPLPAVKRVSLGRMMLPFVVLRMFFRIQPEILIISTHELLLAGLVYKAIFRTRLVYDVQENYRLNILHTNVFPPIVRQVLATWVRLKEQFVSPQIDMFLLAEQGFRTELPFARKRSIVRSIVIENKAVIPSGFIRRPKEDVIELVFTGTIDESTGVYEAIKLIRHLHDFDKRYSLHIIGFCARPFALEILKDMIAPFPFISLTGGDTLQPHSAIMNAISMAHYGLILYRPSPHINNRMPTKLYEYLACRLPIIIRSDLWWGELITKEQAGLVINMDELNARELIEKLSPMNFYPAGARNMSYEFDRQRLVDAIDLLTSEKNSPKGLARKLRTLP